MLNGNYVIVANQPQDTDDVFPYCSTMAVTNTAESPGPIDNLVVGLVIVAAVDRDVDFINVTIFAVNVIRTRLNFGFQNSNFEF